MLAARAAGAVGVHAHVGGVDVDFDGIVNFRVNEDGRKRGVPPAGRVKGRFAHQPVHARFGAQQAEGVFAFHFDGGAFDAGGFARRFVFQIGFEAFALGVFQVLAQQHAGPVLRFGAARAGLDVDEAIAGVGRLVEHAAKFQLLDRALQALHVVGNGLQGGFVAFFAAHFIQLGVVGQVARQVVEHEHHVVEALFFLAQLLGFLGVVPDGGVFQRGVHGAQAVGLGRVVKDTPVARRCGR